jgi:putative ABC transport system substrate-binding protein
MIVRRKLLLVFSALAAVPKMLLAQSAPKLRRIGFLGVGASATYGHLLKAFLEGMRQLGYVEGNNVAYEVRWPEGGNDRLLALASELVEANVEVIVTSTDFAIRIVQKATTTVPIVMAASGDPVGSGFATSLARPGGNITGLSTLTADTSQKLLELLVTMAPKAARIAVLVDPTYPTHPAILKGIQAAAQRTGRQVLPANVRTPEELGNVFAMIGRERAGALIVPTATLFYSQRQRVAELAAKYRLPSIFSLSEYVEAGGLMSYGQNLTKFFRSAATYVDKILKGAHPGELPIQQPTMIHLVINRKTAKSLGLTIPQELLLRADEVIE